MKHGHTFTCGDHEQLIAYLYEECGEEVRAAVSTHLPSCDRCADELAGLSGTRQLLAAWVPPDVQLGLRLADESAGAGRAGGEPRSRGSWVRQPLPAWAQLAAAAAIFAAGVAAGASRVPDSDPAAQRMQRQLAEAAAAVEALESRVQGMERIATRPAPRPETSTTAAQAADVMPSVNARIATWERRIRDDLATREEMAWQFMQLKREEAVMRQQMREEFQTGLSEVSRRLLSWHPSE